MTDPNEDSLALHRLGNERERDPCKIIVTITRRILMILTMWEKRLIYINGRDWI